MSASNEWTEWHLTPRGWEAGSMRVDGPGIIEKEPPSDRVLTTRFTEYLGSAYGKMKRYSEELWRSDDKQARERLLAEFGPPPQKA